MCYRDDKTKLMWEINTVHKIPNLKGIYAVLSRIWKCRKSRIFGANFFGGILVGANFYAFCNYDLVAKFGTNASGATWSLVAKFGTSASAFGGQIS